MTLVSYAQNGEDALLMRALGDVERGFYVDVGAADPTQHSVTRAFYDRGWNGVNVEPTAEHFHELVTQRPRDVNLQVALDARDGEQVFHAIRGSGLSTLDPSLAERHGAAGWAVDRVVIETRTLASVCEQYATGTIHFLKVDVEGAEDRVLQGADFGRFRPWIVLVEATRPSTRESNHAGWEPILLQAGYEFVWFDALNRFYLAHERLGALRRHFVVPLSLFDGYAPHDPDRERVEALAASVPTLADRAEAAEGRAALAERQATEALAEAASQVERAGRARDAAALRADAADAAAGLLDARMRSSDALAQAAAANAEAAGAQVEAAHARLNDLRHDLQETRRRHDEHRERAEAGRLLLGAQAAEAEAKMVLARRELAETVDAHDRLQTRLDQAEANARALERRIAASQAEADSQLAAMARELDDRVAAHESLVARLEVEEAATRAREREAPLVPTEPMPVAPVPAVEESVMVPVRLRSRRRSVAERLYRVLLRPVVRPVAWRLRSFLVAGVRQAVAEQLVEVRGRQDRVLDMVHRVEDRCAAMGERQERGFVDVSARLNDVERRQERILEMVHHVEDGAAELRARHHHGLAEMRDRADEAIRRVEAALGAGKGGDLTGLAASMETALLSLAAVGRVRQR